MKFILNIIITIFAFIQHFGPFCILICLLKTTTDIVLGIQLHESDFLIQELFIAFSFLCCTCLKIFNPKEYGYIEQNVSLIEYIIIVICDWKNDLIKNKTCKEVEEYMKKYHKEIDLNEQ